MDEKTAQVIEKLADKLGVTAEYLWGVLIKQAPIDAALGIAVAAALTIAAVIAVRNALAYQKKSEFDEGQALRNVIAVVLCLGALGAVVTALPIATTALLNPEYWALQQVLKKL